MSIAGTGAPPDRLVGLLGKLANLDRRHGATVALQRDSIRRTRSKWSQTASRGDDSSSAVTTCCQIKCAVRPTPDNRSTTMRSPVSTHHPTSDRPEMPDGYGVPADSIDLLNWADVERRLLRHGVTLTRAARRTPRVRRSSRAS